INVSLGEAADGAFSAEIALTDLDAPFLAAPNAVLSAQGRAENLSDPQNRALTFTVTGRAADLGSSVGGVADALGSSLSLDVSGSWQAGSPVSIQNAALQTDTANARFAGEIGGGLNGTYALSTPSLAAFSGLAGRPLDGSIDLTADGSIGFDGLFDLAIDATGETISFGAGPDGLLDGTTTINGRAARSEDGVSFQNLAIRNPQVSLIVDGAVLPDRADLLARLTLQNLNAIDPQLSGALEARLNVTGSATQPDLVARITSAQIGLGDKALTDLEASFDGTFDPGSDMAADIDGRIAVNGQLEGEPLRLTAELESTQGARVLRRLDARVLDATASGSIALRDGLTSGDLSVNVPELSRLAALALTTARGSVEADVSLRAGDDRQAVSIQGTARDVALAGTSLGFVTADLSIEDVFSIPVLDGTAEVRALTAGGFTVRTMDLTARQEGENATDITLTADFGQGTLDAEGRLERIAEGFAATLRRFRVAGSGQTATLDAPTRVTVTDAITVEDAQLTVGSGRITLGGQLGETLDFSAQIQTLPLTIANIIRADLGLGGAVDGDVRVSGTRDDPVIQADIEATGVTAKILRDRGIEPLTIDADARYADGTATINTLRTEIGGGLLTASGTAGETFDLTVDVTRLPLALANAFVPDLAISGTASGEAEVTGTLSDPRATFEVSATAVSAKPLRDAGIDPVEITATGTYADATAQLSNARLTLGGGTVVASGTAGERLDLDVALTDLPLALANAFVPNLGAAGTLSGTASIEGRPARPSATFNLSSPALSTAATRGAGLGPGELRASGRLEGTTVRFDEAVLAIGGVWLLPFDRPAFASDQLSNAVPILIATGLAGALYMML
ncbi:MAG: hypothetical protein AAFW98_05875, partial [Pseudomonadota bacterium]